MLQMLEFVTTYAYVFKNVPVPQDDLDELWKLLLLNQFHDVLPGTSINAAYIDSELHYKTIAEKSKLLTQRALNKLMAVAGKPASRALVNALPWPRTEIVEGFVALTESIDSENSQMSYKGDLLAVATAPPSSITPIDTLRALTTERPPPATVQKLKDGFLLENQYLTAKIGKDGRLLSLIHKATEREAITDQAGNRFVMFEDMPIFWDAW